MTTTSTEYERFSKERDNALQTDGVPLTDLTRAAYEIGYKEAMMNDSRSLVVMMKPRPQEEQQWQSQ
jgi:hypothetical protein